MTQLNLPTWRRTHGGRLQTATNRQLDRPKPGTGTAQPGFDQIVLTIQPI
jgi:hypothetical protein